MMDATDLIELQREHYDDVNYKKCRIQNDLRDDTKSANWSSEMKVMNTQS